MDVDPNVGSLGVAPQSRALGVRALIGVDESCEHIGLETDGLGIQLFYALA